MKRNVTLQYAVWITEECVVDIPDDMPREQWREFIESGQAHVLMDDHEEGQPVEEIRAQWSDDDGPL